MRLRVQTEPTDADMWDFDEKKGFLTRKIDLGPRHTQTIEFTYAIHARSNVELPF